MLPILPLLLILLFPGVAAAKVGVPAGIEARIERRLVAALVVAVREEAEREALASSVTPRPVASATPEFTIRDSGFVVRDSDRVRDGPRG